MLTKKFLAVRVSEAPVEGDLHEYLLLGQDAEMWRVGRSLGLDSQWTLGEVVELPLRYLGAERVRPDFEAVGCDRWQSLRADYPRAAVVKFWGDDIADRFLTTDNDND